MDSTLTQTMFMRGEVQLGKGLQLLRRKVISIPVLRGEVQPDHLIPAVDAAWEFQFPYCVGKFNYAIISGLHYRSIFQFPYCVGKFNMNNWNDYIEE